MRHAPPVSVLCQGRGWRLAQAGLYATTAATLVLWAGQHLGLSAALGQAAAACAGLGAAAGAWRALRQPACHLAWDGQQWQADGEPVAVQLISLGERLALLKLRTPAGIRWLALGPADAGPAWHGLRVALLAARPERQDAIIGKAAG